MRFSKARQQELYAKYAEAAVDQIMISLINDRQLIIDLGSARAFGAGLDEYGDATFHIAPLALERELAAELADAVFYAIVQLAREAGELLSRESRTENPALIE